MWALDSDLVFAKNDTTILSILIQNGADVNATCSNGIPVLDYAFMTGSIPAIELFLNSGADPKQSDKYGNTILDRAVASLAKKKLYLKDVWGDDEMMDDAIRDIAGKNWGISINCINLSDELPRLGGLNRSQNGPVFRIECTRNRRRRLNCLPLRGLVFLESIRRRYFRLAGSDPLFRGSHFSVNGEEIKQGEASGIYLKHCVTNTLDEFMQRGERGEAATFASQGQNIAEREKNAYKYAIDLFLMYISQETTPNILPNKAIADKAAKVEDFFACNASKDSRSPALSSVWRERALRSAASREPSAYPVMS